MGRKLGIGSLFFRTREPKPSPPWPSCKQPEPQPERPLDLLSVGETAAAESLAESLRSGRLMLDPGTGSSPSILEAPATRERPAGGDGVARAWGPPEGAVAVEVESVDPCRDFRASMEEMVGAHGKGGGVGDWVWMEELLGWYLKVNGKGSHGFIIGAFVDLLLGIANDSSSCSPPSSNSTPYSSGSSSSPLRARGWVV